jgi:DNA-binding winged helix-turn-helix (wHTH) protein
MIDTQKPFTIANITIIPKTDEICCNGVTIEIKSMSMKIICYFAEHHEQIISRESLKNILWKSTKTSDHTINNHIYNLRKIFAEFDDQTKFFHTVTGNQSGYRLLAKVDQNLSTVIHELTTESVLNEEQSDNQNIDVKQNQRTKNTIPLSRTKKINKLSKEKVIKRAVNLIIVLLIIIVTVLLIPSKPSYNSMLPLTLMAGREQNPSISQDGAIILYANRSSRDSTWELYASRLHASTEILQKNKIFNAKSKNDNYVSISPNKKQIAFIRYPKNERGIYLADFDEHSLSATNDRLIIPLKTMNLSPAISWLNDSQFFYTATEAISAPRKIFSYDIVQDHSEQISAPPLNTFGDYAAVVSPNKNWLAIMRADQSYGYELFLYDLQRKLLLPTPIKNSEERLNISFSDDSQKVFFIDQQGYLSSYLISAQKIDVISTIKHPGYWPLKVPESNQFIIQQDWGLSSLTNKIVKISNPQIGGDGKRETVVDNGLSVRAITGIDKGGLIFASIKANQKIELWKYQQGKSEKLEAFNNTPQYKSALSLDWLQGSNKALLSINNTCYLIDIDTGKDSPLCPANESLYAGRFAKNGQSIYLAGEHNNHFRTVEMGISGYPFKPIPEMSAANSIHQGQHDDFYYSMNESFNIYHLNLETGENKKIIERTYVIERFSNNDFIVSKNGIYFMDRKEIKQNAIYFYNFKNQKINYVIPSKDNYPHFVLSDDEKFIYLIESYDNDSKLSLIK